MRSGHGTNEPGGQEVEPSTAGASGGRDLEGLRDVQGRHGNWNYSPYMRGLYNGLELAQATLEGREPIYRDAPAQYLCELETPDAMSIISAQL